MTVSVPHMTVTLAARAAVRAFTRTRKAAAQAPRLLAAPSPRLASTVGTMFALGAISLPCRSASSTPARCSSPARAASVALVPTVDMSEKRGKSRDALTLKEGDQLHGFTVSSVEFVKDFNVTAVTLTHDKTGAKYLHADCEDSNNSFNVTFRTTPTDSTGVAHILEHTVLCGSAKYPVRDPFFNMLKRSLNTFMNAMTAPDFTMYPFSTRNVADYYNLLSVYLDSVFFPKITKNDFQQEGHRLEFKDPEDPASPLMFKGVVFNEMKGAMSSADSQFSRALSKYVYPTSTYHHNSGGDPVNIPELTHQDLIDFHATHYHPSNACIFSYGDLPLAETLQRVNDWALDRFDKLDVSNLDVQDETREATPRKFTVQGPTDAVVTNPDKQSVISVGYLLNNIVDDPFEVFKLRVASDLLISGPNAPFYKALVEPGYGSGYAPATGYGAQRREASFAVGLKGVSNDDVQMIEELILDTFSKVAEEGFDMDRVEAVIHQIELNTRNVSTNFGLGMGFSIMPYWLHGGDPLSAMRVGETVDRLRSEMKQDPLFWQKVLSKYFVSNQHRVTLYMTPDAEYNNKLEAEEAERLKAMQAELDEPTKARLVAEARELKAAQETLQPVELLPTLTVDDIPVVMERTESKHDDVAGIKVQWDDQPTNGITFISMMYDLSELPEHLVPYLPLFTQLLTEMGTKSMDYRSLAEAIKSSTGGVSASLSGANSTSDMDVHTNSLVVRSSCLDRNLDKMFALLQELTSEGGVRWHEEEARLKTLLTRRAAGLAASVAAQGLSYARAHAESTLTKEGAEDNQQSGIPHVNFMQQLVGPGADLSKLKKGGDVPAALEAIALFLFGGRVSGATSRLLRCRVAGEGQQFEQVKTLLSKCIENQGAPRIDAGASVGKDFKPYASKTFFAVPSQTNYAAQCFRTVPYAHKDAAALLLLGQVLSTCFLHREIREKGGAYGGGASYSPLGGIFSMTSYRDPRTLETLETFAEGCKWAAKSDSFTERDLDEAKLRAFKSLDAPVAPSGRGAAYFSNNELDDDTRQAFRKRVLEVTQEDVNRAAQKYLVEGLHASSMAIVGNQAKVAVVHGKDGWEVLDAQMKPFVSTT